MKAVQYYRLAAEQRNVDAQFNLGWCYQHGKGVLKNRMEAVKYYRLAADQGDADAKTILESLLEEYPHLKYQQTSAPQTPFFSLPDDSTTTNNQKVYGGPIPGRILLS